MGDQDQKFVSERLRAHYAETFRAHGASSKGVDWGEREADAILRYDNMLAVIKPEHRSKAVRLLDVGCGYGGLLDRITELGLDVEYMGVDIVEDMVATGRKRHPAARFECMDVFEDIGLESYDYVVCNGILTQMLDVPIGHRDRFAHSLIKRMYELCSEGIAFNLMSNRVNFMVSNLYYKSPIEMLNWCMTEVSPNARLDHSYPLYEFMIYLYRSGVPR